MTKHQQLRDIAHTINEGNVEQSELMMKAYLIANNIIPLGQDFDELTDVCYDLVRELHDHMAVLHTRVLGL